MSASRTFVHFAVTCLFTLGLAAQNQPSQAIQILLPPDAKIIETADLTVAPGKLRQLVLWMENPQRVLRDDPGGEYCGNSVYGDHWYGPARLSLVDPAKHTLINTVAIRDFFEHDGDDEHNFPIPFFVSNDFYNVPRPDLKKEGTPKLLNLTDLTGEGLEGQFVLFEHEVCGVALTSAFGYSPMFDLAIQYHVEVLGKDAPRLDSWVATIFARKPVRPGYWNFAWEPGHGANAMIHEEVTFDRVRQLFVDEQTITPISGTIPPN